MTRGPRVCDGITHAFFYGGIAYLVPSECANPSWLQCLCGFKVLRACGRCSADACVACAKKFLGRLFQVCRSGLECGPGESILMLTLTIPGEEAHSLKDGTICACTPLGGVNVAEENALFGQRFNRLIQALRRRYDLDFQYFRVMEIQVARGALHAHVLIRTTAAAAVLADFSARDPHCRVRELVMAHGFGHEVDLVAADTKSAVYVIKYVTKAATDRKAIEWLDLATGVISQGNARYRVWSASKQWGTTMRGVREAQAAWARKEPIPSETDPKEAQPPQAAETPGPSRRDGPS